MQKRASTWTDVALSNTDAYDMSCDYRFKMAIPTTGWRPGVAGGDFWYYLEQISLQSVIANYNNGPQIFSVKANNKTVFDFNGVNGGTVLQMQKRCNVSAVTTPLVCPAGQDKIIDPNSPVCILRANVITNLSTDFVLTGYDHLAGNCTLAGVVPQAPQTASNQISVTA
jgi:hypothetical protein